MGSTIPFSLNFDPWLKASICKEAADRLPISLAYQQDVTVIDDALAGSVGLNRYIFPHTHDRRFLIIPLDSVENTKFSMHRERISISNYKEVSAS